MDFHFCFPLSRLFLPNIGGFQKWKCILLCVELILFFKISLLTYIWKYNFIQALSYRNSSAFVFLKIYMIVVTQFPAIVLLQIYHLTKLLLK